MATIKLFGKKIDSIRLGGKDYPIKKNMCLRLKRWNQIYEQYDYLCIRGIKEITSFLMFNTILNFSNIESTFDFEVLYE